MPNDDLERRFHERMLDIYAEAQQTGYRPTYFLRMVHERGGIEAAKQLIDAPTISEGFVKLFELGRLDLSVEAVATLPEYRVLFSPEQLARARQRLGELGFDS